MDVDTDTRTHTHTHARTHARTHSKVQHNTAANHFVNYSIGPTCSMLLKIFSNTDRSRDGVVTLDEDDIPEADARRAILARLPELLLF